VLNENSPQEKEILSEEKENQIPNEPEEVEPNVVQHLKNEEDTSESLKSLDGQFFGC
jgi:hypothetical protein